MQEEKLDVTFRPFTKLEGLAIQVQKITFLVATDKKGSFQRITKPVTSVLNTTRINVTIRSESDNATTRTTSEPGKKVGKFMM